jgi:hypothetical protein
MSEQSGALRDPWAELGLAAGATIEQARAARRRLAKQLHPDLHACLPPAERADLDSRMARVNRALSELEAFGHEGAGPGEAAPGRAEGSDPVRPASGPDPAHRRAAPVDGDSFSVGVLPVEAYESVFLVAYGLGEILTSDEPYALDAYLSEPRPCFCQLWLAPEAGGTIVTIDVLPAEEDVEAPAVAAVRDRLVAELNDLAGTCF